MMALLSSEDEPEDLEWGRLTELQRRNTLCLPHMRSCYPVELQTAATVEGDALALDDSLEVTGVSHKRALPSDAIVESRLRKRKVIVLI